MPPCEGGYKEFKIGDLFKAQTGDVDLQQKDINGLGTYFVNSGVQNFGIKGKTDREARVFPANTITIDFFGNSYYRPYEYKLATHNHVFSLSGDVIKNELVGLYLTSCMSYMRNIFSFNNMGTWSVIKNLNVILPVTKSGEIDFQYIEERMRELEEERMRELEAYLAAAGFANCDLTPEEQVALRKFSNGEVKFTSYRIGDLFEIKTAKSIDKGRLNIAKDKYAGAYQFIGRTSINNGIQGYTNKLSFEPNQRNTFSIIQVGESVMQFREEEWYASQNLFCLSPLYPQIANNFMYFIGATNKALMRFNGGYTDYPTLKSLTDLEISLPILSSRDIDYDFMETYISAIKKQIIARLKAEIAREHKAYESVING